MLRFVIPIRHPNQVTDIEEQRGILRQTIDCLKLQKGDQWQAIIVANPGTPIPDLPPQISVKWVDIAPNEGFAKATTRQEFFEVVRDDKGQRLLEGVRDIGPDDYVMVVDDDDLIDPSLASFVLDQPLRNGWFVENGYRWNTTTGEVLDMSGFHMSCGTCLIVRAGYYQFFDQLKTGVSQEAIQELGSHRQVFDRATLEGTPFAEIPFRAAVYRTAHQTSVISDISSRKLAIWNRGLRGTVHMLRYNLGKLKRRLAGDQGPEPEAKAEPTVRTEDFLIEKYGITID